MAYTVRLKPRAERELDGLPTPVARRIWDRLLSLEEEPSPRGTTKPEGSDGYRVRLGDYRAVYLIDDRQKATEIDLVRISHRREIYR